MNPDSFMPLYGDEFFAAIEGLPENIGMGYLRAIWHYWGHTHATGLRDDPEFLRRLCRIERHDWEEARAVIFDNDKFFTLGEDGKWHQSRAASEWKKSKDAYDLKLKRATDGAKARWRKVRRPPPPRR